MRSLPKFPGSSDPKPPPLFFLNPLTRAGGMVLSSGSVNPQFLCVLMLCPNSYLTMHVITYTQRILTPIDLKAGTVFIKGSTHFSPRGCARKSGCKKKLFNQVVKPCVARAEIFIFRSLLHVDYDNRGRFLVDPDYPTTIDLDFCLIRLKRWR